MEYKRTELDRILQDGADAERYVFTYRPDLTELRAVRLAGERAFAMAGRAPADIQVAEVHDCFTIAEICVIEALGLVEKGKGGQAAESGLTALDGKIPVNTSGGVTDRPAMAATRSAMPDRISGL